MNKRSSNLQRDPEIPSSDYMIRYATLSQAESVLQESDAVFNRVGPKYYGKAPFIGKHFALFGTRLHISPIDGGVEYGVKSRHHNAEYWLGLFASNGEYSLRFEPRSHQIGALPTPQRPEMTMNELLDGSETTATETAAFVAQALRVGAYAATCVGIYNRNELAIESPRDMLRQISK